jgi:transposase InsO family protein
MTTVAEMIEWLKTLPQDAEVECGVEERGSYESHMVYRHVDIESCEVFDYTGEKYNTCRYAGRIIVQIQGE